MIAVLYLVDPRILFNDGMKLIGFPQDHTLT